MEILTELVTPFNEANQIDFNSLASLLQQQLNLGITNFYISNALSQYATLSIGEQKKYYDFIKNFASNSKLYLEIPMNLYFTEIKENLFYYSSIDYFVGKHFLKEEIVNLEKLNKPYYLYINQFDESILNVPHKSLRGVVIDKSEKKLVKQFKASYSNLKIITKQKTKVRNSINYEVDGFCSSLPLIIGEDMLYYIDNVQYSNNVEILEDYIDMISNYIDRAKREVDLIKYLLYKKKIIPHYHQFDFFSQRQKVFLDDLSNRIY